MGMFLSNVVFPPPASGAVTFLLFFSYFCSNKTNSLQFISEKLCHGFPTLAVSPTSEGVCGGSPGGHLPPGCCAGTVPSGLYFGRVWLPWAQPGTQGNETRLGTSQKQLYLNSVELSQAW